VEARIIGTMYHFPTRRTIRIDVDRRHGLLNRGPEQESQLLRLAAKQTPDALARTDQADDDPEIGIALHLVEHHDRAALAGWAEARAAGADVAIDAGQLGFRIDRFVGFDVFALVLLEEFERRAQVVDLGCADGVPVHFMGLRDTSSRVCDARSGVVNGMARRAPSARLARRNRAPEFDTAGTISCSRRLSESPRSCH